MSNTRTSRTTLNLSPERIGNIGGGVCGLWNHRHCRRCCPLGKSAAGVDVTKKKKKKTSTPHFTRTGADSADSDALFSPEWNAMYQRLQVFQQTFGDCLVPSDYPADPPLYQWLLQQRRDKERAVLTLDQQQALTNLPGFLWDIATDPEQCWMLLFGRLQRFHATNGHSSVPRSYPPDPQLSTWVAWQRLCRPTLEGRAHKMDLLENVGFVWKEETGNASRTTANITNNNKRRKIAAESDNDGTTNTAIRIVGRQAAPIPSMDELISMWQQQTNQIRTTRKQIRDNEEMIDNQQATMEEHGNRMDYLLQALMEQKRNGPTSGS